MNPEELQARLAELRDLHTRGVLSDKLYQDALKELGISPEEEGKKVDLSNSQGGLYKPTGPVEQQFGDQIDITGDATTALGERGMAIGRESIVITGDGARVIIGEQPVNTTAVDHDAALARYLRHIIAQNRYLTLQGIRSGGKLVSIELERIYVTLRATRQRTIAAEEDWLAEEMRHAPGEFAGRRALVGDQSRTETVTVSVNEALAAHPHLVVLGDPGSGKTTLLRYLALLYARDLAEGDGVLAAQLGLTERGLLPVLIPLRRLGAYLKAHRPADDGTEGHAVLLEHYREMLRGERVFLPETFFDAYLESGRVVFLLDGLDEVADPQLRQRAARLIEATTRAYPHCRYVVSSRIVGYTGTARLAEDYVTTTVREFSDTDIVQFLHNWHLAVAVGQLGPGESAITYAAQQTAQLQAALQANARVRELALNPLLLTVIALVHRDRVKLPDRRAELYAEAVDVLLGKWDEAKSVQEVAILENRPFDAGDKKLLLQHIALTMQEAQLRDIELRKLHEVVRGHFREITTDAGAARRATERFLRVVEERAGLLIGRGEGVYAFSHLTFQEYLAALALAARDDYVETTLQHCSDPWWREVLLLEAGYLSMQSCERATRLVRAIAECRDASEPYHNLVLAAEMLRDIGEGRVAGDLASWVQRQLRADIEVDVQAEVARRRPRSGWEGLWQRARGAAFDEREVIKEVLQRKGEAMEALVRAGAGYWSAPYGEPEWVEIPAGEFWMGAKQYDHEKPVHKVCLDRYWIAETPITNAQYRLFVEATQHAAPEYWENGKVPRGLESHPVVQVTWHDALAYCRWLSKVTGKAITLPSEAEWEKAARGDKDKREYPWGDGWDTLKCNTEDLGLGGTTPVGIFSEGASPYGCLDLVGNVWQWTRSHWKAYPYDLRDGREKLEAGDTIHRVLRGGSFYLIKGYARCSYRGTSYPYNRLRDVGFRVCVVSRQE
jgi:formylglycine-generating enzyme required for sulfatase activity/energy-coupling factor transporter ATP-binding protein EcfA2